MAYAQVSSLDYADIRATLVDYLRRNTDFTDYDFEGSQSGSKGRSTVFKAVLFFETPILSMV